MWERRLYHRSLYVPYRKQDDDSEPSSITRLWRWRSPLGAIVVVFGLASWFIFAICLALGFYITSGFSALNSVSGGALLASLGTHVHFFGRFIKHIDKQICREVVTGELSCIITPNPDVAGIGVSRLRSLFLSCQLYWVIPRVESLSIRRLPCS
jgi:hypothetical protein